MLTIKRWKRKHIGLFLLSTAILILWIVVLYAKRFTHPAAPQPPIVHKGKYLIIPENSPMRTLVKLRTISKKRVAVPFTLPATVEPDPTKIVRVLPPALGRIVSLNKRLGDYVRKGELLLTINSADLAQAQSDIERARAAQAVALQNLKRQTKLLAAKIGSQQDKEQAQNAFDQAASEYMRAKAKLNMLKSSHAKNARLSVRAPRAGHVVELNAAVGMFWNDATAPIMTVADLSVVYVTAEAQEKDLGQLYPHQTVDVTFDAYPETLRTTVVFISPILDPDTRTIPVSMIFKNPEGRLKPNMFAKAVFLGLPEPRIFLPLTAVIQRGFDSIVYVESSAWRFEPRSVQLGAQLANNIEILSGLNVGERVAVAGSILFQ